MSITEKYFVSRGWERPPSYAFAAGIKLKDVPWESLWIADKKELTSPAPVYYRTLPNITQNFPDFKKWVLEPMEGFHYEILENISGDAVFFHWMPGHEHNGCITEEIINNEILEAAVIAATRYWKVKNE